jgi:hypothetical protein
VSLVIQKIGLSQRIFLATCPYSLEQLL